MKYFGDASRSIDCLSLGHLTIDRHPIGDRPGGTVSYAARVAARLGIQIGVVTSAHPDINPKQWIEPGADYAVKAAAHTTTFKNIYETSGRRQILTNVADNVGLADAPTQWRKARIIHLAPLVGEIGPKEILFCPAASLICATLQGWLRSWDLSEGLVRPETHPQLFGCLQYLDATVVSAEDLKGLDTTMQRLISDARLIAVTKGAAGAEIWANGLLLDHIEALPKAVLDPTGAGDVFAATWFVRLAAGDDPIVAARSACCAASLSISAEGIDAISDDATIRRRLNWE